MKRIAIAEILERLGNFFSAERKLRSEFHLAWGQEKPKTVRRLDSYLKLTEGQAKAGIVDENTWVNLELPKIFLTMDTTVTPVGSQYLYKMLHEYRNDEQELKRRYQCYVELSGNRPLREDLQVKLAGLGDGSAGIADVVYGEELDKPKYAKFIVAWSLCLIAVPLVILFFSLPPVLWLIPIAINVMAIFFLSLNTDYQVSILRSCYRLTWIADKLATVKTDLKEVNVLINKLKASEGARKRIQKILTCYSYGNKVSVYTTLSIWLNVLFYFEDLMYVYVVTRFSKARSDLAADFEVLGELDAAIAIASFLQRYPEHCQPSLGADKVLDIAEAYHPLLTQPVKNHIKLSEQSMLITGSNMAGKTTYIKTVGTNLVFGRTLGFCFATHATIPNSSVMASIRAEHSIESGKSQYYVEIESILSFIKGAKSGECKVFLIDELFSGTNTIERIAAARAVLESLSEYGQVLVTTHDVELQQLLNQRFSLYHFQEDPDVDGFFDYLLREGKATRKNAIRLLQRLGFPADVVEKAMLYANED